MRRIPAIVSDIDGVIVRGKQLINRSDIVINDLVGKRYQLDNQQQMQIPFYLLTNGGGCVEKDKADSLNKVCNSRLTTDNVILNFTPLRPIMAEYSDKQVLICGAGKIGEISESCLLKKYVLINEISAISNQLQFKTPINVEQSKHNLIKRGIDPNVNLSEFEAVFIVYDPIEWEDCLQTIVNILRVKDIPIYVVNNDITYSDSFWLPRLAFGSFNATLQSVVYNMLNRYPNIIYYGKPCRNTFDYVECKIKQNQPNVGNIYMIGDNPKSDIRGANQIGWESILVRSGMFHGENDDIDPAKFVVFYITKQVETMYDAYQLILNRESLNLI